MHRIREGLQGLIILGIMEIQGILRAVVVPWVIVEETAVKVALFSNNT